MTLKKTPVETDLFEPQHAPGEAVRAETKHLEEEYRESQDGVEHSDMPQDDDPKLVLDKMFHEPI